MCVDVNVNVNVNVNFVSRLRETIICDNIKRVESIVKSGRMYEGLSIVEMNEQQ